MAHLDNIEIGHRNYCRGILFEVFGILFRSCSRFASITIFVYTTLTSF